MTTMMMTKHTTNCKKPLIAEKRSIERDVGICKREIKSHFYLVLSNIDCYGSVCIYIS